MQGFSNTPTMPTNNTLDRERTIYDKHREAAEEFHAACHNFYNAAQRKLSAEQALQNVSKELAEVMQQITQDPTIPQAQVPKQYAPMSGQIGGARDSF